MRRLSVLFVVLSLTLAACADDRSPNVGDDGGSGLRGVVSLGPLCPVQTVEDPCPDEPLPDTTVRILRGEEVVATVTSDDRGRFEIALEPGSYTLLAVANDDGARSAKPVAVTVPADGYAQVSVSVDTGIR